MRISQVSSNAVEFVQRVMETRKTMRSSDDTRASHRILDFSLIVGPSTTNLP